MKMKGIDVSSYNKITDYLKVKKDGIEFAIIKIIRKDLKPDTLFETHWNGFENADIPIQGVYNYSYATTIDKFRSDAARVVEVLNGRKTMVWLDIEDSCQSKLGSVLADGICEYAKVIKKAGLQFGVYTGLSFYNSYLKKYESQFDFPFWIARYPSSNQMTVSQEPNDSKKPYIEKNIYGWQYSSKGKVNGVNGDVDMNEWYVSIEAKTVVEKETDTYYTRNEFRENMAKVLGLSTTSTPEEILAKTVTISSSTNKNHVCVTLLERLLKEHGYYNGVIEADLGKNPIFGNGMAKATALYQSNIVGLKRPDSIWTGRTGASYKKALK